MKIDLTNFWNRARGVLTIAPLLCGVAFGELTMPARALAQTESPLQFTSTDRNMLRAQLDLALVFAKQVQDILQQSPTESGLERAIALNYESYKLLRFAHQGVLNIKGETSRSRVNPLLQIVSDTLQQARDRNLKARAIMKDSIQWAKQRSAGVPAAMNEIQSMIRFTQDAEELL